jgi:hypothetical protein
MKWLLGVSFILNLILGFKIYNHVPEAPQERLIIESHSELQNRVHPRPHKECSPKVIVKKCQDHLSKSAESSENEEKSESVPEPFPEPEEWILAEEKLETKRVRFFEEELQMSPIQVEQYRDLKGKFESQLRSVSEPDVAEESFETQRSRIDIEENYHEKVKKLFGRERWERYQQFRKQHNQRRFNLGNQENDPFIFMRL